MLTAPPLSFKIAVYIYSDISIKLWMCTAQLKPHSYLSKLELHLVIQVNHFVENLKDTRNLKDFGIRIAQEIISDDKRF